jgi:hypothetical protein
MRSVPIKRGLRVSWSWGTNAPDMDGTAVGSCSFMIHVRHAAAAIATGLETARSSMFER